LEKQDAVKETYLELRDLIVRGSMGPGSPLIERRVAEVVDSSRSTVRSALQRLAHEGFVTVSKIGSSYSRYFVRSLTISEMRERYYIYGALDGLAARAAAGLPEEERKEIAEAGRQLAQAHLEAGSGSEPHYDRVQQLDSRFHATYVQAGGGPILLKEHASLAPHVERYGRFYATALIQTLPSDVFIEHNAIVDAIEDGNADAAERAAVTNWRNATTRFAAVMRRRGEQG
jgi:DNA-binding GntR family transcriptional regulator